jgi:integrase
MFGKDTQGTVAELFNLYLDDGRFTRLAADTQRYYHTHIRLATRLDMGMGRCFGELKVSEITPLHADEFYKKYRFIHTEQMAVICCRVMRRVFGIGFRWGKVTSNPFQGIELPELPERSTLWSPEDIEKFIYTANQEGHPEIGWLMRMGYTTANRIKDLLTLTINDFTTDKGVLHLIVKQSKTHEIVYIPIIDPSLSGYVSQCSGFLFTAPNTTTPYSYRDYWRLYHHILLIAGLPKGLQFRDVRRTVATELGDAGATEQETNAITGWRPGSQVSRRYVRRSNAQALNAVRKRNAMKEGV